jgi:hypothetical protein
LKNCWRSRFVTLSPLANGLDIHGDLSDGDSGDRTDGPESSPRSHESKPLSGLHGRQSYREAQVLELAGCPPLDGGLVGFFKVAHAEVRAFPASREHVEDDRQDFVREGDYRAFEAFFALSWRKREPR